MQKHTLCFEQAVSENSRIYLRLENLIQKANHFLPGSSPWASRACISAILDILMMLSKPDLKKRLIHEITRFLSGLNQLKRYTQIDASKWQETHDQLNHILEKLNQHHGRFAHALHEHTFLNNLKQASHHANDKHFFDTSDFQYWLQLSSEKRVQQLTQWLQQFNEIYAVIRVILRLIRDSGSPTIVDASNGFFQTSLDKQTTCHLIRVELDEGSEAFPDISLGGHVLTIRFMSLADPERTPSTVCQNIHFRLTRCIL